MTSSSVAPERELPTTPEAVTVAASASQRARLALLWRYVRPRSGMLALALLLGLGASATGLLSPLVTREVLSALGGGGSLSGPIALLAALLVVGGIVSWWQWMLLGSLAEHIVYDVREGMIRRFVRAKVLPLLSRPAGELVARVTSDSVLLREAASQSVIGVVNGTVMLVGTIVLMAVLDVPLVLATVGAVAVVLVFFAVLMPAIGHAQERSQAALGRLGGELDGTLRAIKTVKVAGAERRQIDRLLDSADEAKRESIVAVRREALVWTISWTGIQGAVIVILGFGAWRVSQGALDVPTLIAFLLYAFGLLGPIMDLSQNLATLQSGLAAAGRILDIERLEQEDAGATTRSSPEAPRGAPAIELRSVTARYAPGGPAAVDGVDLTIPARGHVAIVGLSGAGKTTILSLILRFLEPESGELLLHGTPYARLRTDEIRRPLAYVEQETPTVPGTIAENLRYLAPDATDEELHGILDRLGMSEKIASLPEGLEAVVTDSSLSGGQRQRIALARALVARPDVLLLDEATAQVDGITEAAIHDAVREQARRGAVVTIAHRLSTVVDADEIVVMEAARVIARGTHADLLRDSELYRRLVSALDVRGPSA
ncbi:ABC transporter ATP-binding protein [Microbacterium testaceum]|uniref:ABC transporter ATP-binding protein n=1 Tax=Microbacterium testaceum TaxID=2033 RepID=UPI00343BA27A